jgi:predicted nicotinamide N-methyase
MAGYPAISITRSMRSIQIKYPTITKTRKIGNKTFVVEVIRDLDEAIDLICDAMSPEERLDPFAEDLCPYFGILWPSAEALAQYLTEHSHLVRNKTVLELGSGLGLPSLVATHLVGKVLATDFHPDVEEYFQRNCRHSSITCDYRRLNWRESIEDIGTYDVVMGSDVLYESKHPREVTQGLIRFLKPGGKIILSDPGRAYLQNFLNAMKLEGYAEKMSSIEISGQEIFIFEFDPRV